jgi:hypothetical protein
MLTNILLIIVFSISCKYLIDYIKIIKTGDESHNEENYWKFTYDFRPTKKKDFSPDSPELIMKKRFRDRLIFLLYINIFILFLLTNSLASYVLDGVVN